MRSFLLRPLTVCITAALPALAQIQCQNQPPEYGYTNPGDQLPCPTSSIIGDSGTTPTTPPPAPVPTVISKCPVTIHSLTAICSTCVTIECIMLETLTVNCGCSAGQAATPSEPAVVTVYSSHDCAQGCDALPSGCPTWTEVVTATDCGASGSGSGSQGEEVTSTGGSPTADPTETGSTITLPADESGGSVTPSSSSSSSTVPSGSVPVSSNAARRLGPFRW